MAVNFSHQSVSPNRMPEDNVIDLLPADPFGMDINSSFTAITDWLEEWDLGYGDYKEDFNAGMGGIGHNDDILGLLPADPFGMDICSTLTAINGWIGELELGYSSFEDRTSEYGLCTGLDCFCKETIDLNGNPGATRCNSNLLIESSICYDVSQQAYDTYENFRDEYSDILPAHMMRSHEENGNTSLPDVYISALHFALSYLGLEDILSVAMVCKDLHSAVHSDPFLWQSIHIANPLNEKIADDALLELTSRAQGHLHCLSLVDCPRITIAALKLILERNPNLTKLGMSGCVRLNIDQMVNLVKGFNATGVRGIKYLRVGGLYGMTHEHFAELKILLGVGDDKVGTLGTYRSHFYTRGTLYLSLEDDRAIDVEVCPKCENIRLVYDCPAACCQWKDGTSQICRACVLCIPRCVCCGRCINDDEYEETFFLEFMCSTCWKQIMTPPGGEEACPSKLALAV